uniref:MARVEL domain-containing protein n=1 Tax=Angiostrongylus cantonensis TaxID=6313 RepID=A0A0K0D9U8_ANGCA
MITFVYVVFWPLYEGEKRVALADLAITALFFVLFFFCSASWWAGSNTIGFATSEEQQMSFATHANNGKLVVSVLGDWVCVFTFAMNCWFVWKEVVPRPSQNPSQIA